jgi:acetyl esterase/lipase
VIKRFEPTSIGIVGVSSGGGLAAATILKLRDAGVPLPGAAVLLAPEADLTESGDTIQTNRDLDVVLRHPVPEAIALYANGNDLKDPYLSPLYGDFAKGYCPTFLQSGTRDMMLSDTVRLHRAAPPASTARVRSVPRTSASGARRTKSCRPRGCAPRRAPRPH